MAKISILSPIHVGTGKTVESPSFHIYKDNLYRYELKDVLATMPDNVLLDPGFLDGLAKAQSSKESLYSKINHYARFNHLEPLYPVGWNHIETLSSMKRDFDEQTKDAGKPYIPGSTLKGALEDAWKYMLIKENVKAIAGSLPGYLDEVARSKGNLAMEDGFLLQILDPAFVQDPKSRREASEFMKDVFSCLSVSDVYFEKISIYRQDRFNTEKFSPVVWSYTETIESKQSSNVPVFIQINEARLNRLKTQDSLTWMQKMILDRLTIQDLVKAANDYTYDVIGSLMDANTADFLDEEASSVNTFIDSIENKLRQDLDQKQTMILRVGRYTNYFFKTVSWLFFNDTNLNSLYQEYFKQVFSPVPESRNSRRPKTNPDTMPKTICLFSDQNGYQLPGFIQMELSV